MDAKTEQALRESIAKWEKNSRVRKWENAKIHSDSCPLCGIYNPYESPTGQVDCWGCPIAEAGFPDCHGSPWEDCWLEHESDLPAFRAAAKEEVAFLKSLLPENNQ